MSCKSLNTAVVESCAKDVETIACRLWRKRAKSGWNRADRDAIWCLTEWVVCVCLADCLSPIPSHWRKASLTKGAHVTWIYRCCFVWQVSPVKWHTPTLLFLSKKNTATKLFKSSLMVDWVSAQRVSFPFEHWQHPSSRLLLVVKDFLGSNAAISGHAHRAFCCKWTIMCKFYYVSGKPLFKFFLWNAVV